MWVWLRPHRLQRPLSSIITAVVYCPPDKSAQDRRDLVTYLSDTIDIFRFRYPDCGIVILGDFNGLDTSDLLSSHGLKQLVSNPTRAAKHHQPRILVRIKLHEIKPKEMQGDVCLLPE